jgi:two-component system, chemotaxis family, sensor kinase CheA
VRDEPLPLLPLPKLFNKRAQLQSDSGKLYVVIVNNGKMHVGLVVDELIGQEEVVIKPLEDYLQENSGFSGATILGDGQISLILDVDELVKIILDRKAKMVAEAVM